MPGAVLKTTSPFTYSNSGGSENNGSCRRRSSSGGWRTCKPCGEKRRGGRRSGSRYSAPSAHRHTPLASLASPPAPAACLPCSPIPFPLSFPTPRFLLSFPASLFLSVFSYPSTPNPGSLPSSCLCAFIPHLFAHPLLFSPPLSLMGPPPWLPPHSLPSAGLIPSPTSLLLFPALLLILTPLIPSSSSNSFAAACCPFSASSSFPALCPPSTPTPQEYIRHRLEEEQRQLEILQQQLLQEQALLLVTGSPSFLWEDAYSELLYWNGMGALQGKGLTQASREDISSLGSWRTERACRL